MVVSIFAECFGEFLVVGFRIGAKGSRAESEYAPERELKVLT